MGLQAAEQLVTELAASRVGTDFKTTDDQEELSIPPFLVYLLGIAIAEDEYQRWKDQKPILNNHESSHHFSPIREKRFFAFQKIYLSFAKDPTVHSVEQRIQTSLPLESKLYKLTTRIFPSKDQQAIVKRDLLKECEKLESLSNEALEALLMEEISSSQDASTKNKRRKIKMRKQKSRQHTMETKDNMIVLKIGEEEKKASTLKEFVPTTSQDLGADSSVEEESWVKMKKKCDNIVLKDSSSLRNLVPEDLNPMNTSRPAGPVILKTEFENSMKKENGLTLIKNIGKDHISSDIADNSNEEKVLPLTNVGSQVENIKSLINHLSSPQSIPPNDLPNLNTNGDYVSLHRSVIDISELKNQTQRITDFEHELAEANRQLIDERLTHTRALRKEKERYENLIQALQLRLYISENKLRTYEEALDEHIQAVSAVNISGSTMRKSYDEKRIPSSPSLISKVLQNQSDGKSGESMW